MSKVRLLVDGLADGPRNMAIDEVLLESAATVGTATIRLYRWKSPTLSLGYFQSLSDRTRHEASRTCPVVRRPSGGGAILHDVEWTYSLAVPRRELPGPRPTCLYERIHQAWLRTLRQVVGVSGRILGCQSPATGNAFLCFQRRSPFDVLLGDFKILGSAQRQFRSAILQHGSLLLGRSAFAPELPGVFDLGGAHCEPEAIIGPWCKEVATAMDWAVEAATLADDEQERVDYHTQRLAAVDWTSRRP